MSKFEDLNPANSHWRGLEEQEKQSRADKTKNAEQPALEPITLAGRAAGKKEVARGTFDSHPGDGYPSAWTLHAPTATGLPGEAKQTALPMPASQIVL
jgi:hypothetical protein